MRWLLGLGVLLTVVAAVVTANVTLVCMTSVASTLHASASIADLLKLFLTTSAFVAAIYTLFAKDTRLRAHAEHALVSLILFVIATMIMFAAYAVIVFDIKNAYIVRSFSVPGLFLYMASFLSLTYFVFIRAYNSLYNLRTDKAIKNFKPIRFVRKLFQKHKHYEMHSTERKNEGFALARLTDGLSIDEIEILRSGATVLITGESRRALIDLSTRILTSRLTEEETVNFITTDRPPVHIWSIWKKHDNKLKERRHDIVMIDAFSLTYAFGDDIQDENRRRLEVEEGVDIVPAKSYAGIHTATARAFNIIKKHEKKNKTVKRRPMTMVYAFTSALCEVEGTEQFTVFWRHVIPSEASYKILTIIIEDDQTPSDILRPLRQLCEFEFHISESQESEDGLRIERKR